MKKLLSALAFFSALMLATPQEANATHLAGGEIWYDYIGDSTGTAYQYLVTLRIYKDNSSGTAGLPSTASICVTSSCFSSTSVTLNLNGPQYQSVPGLDPCADDQTDPSYVPLVFNEYRGVVTLGGKCADWQFYWTSCCRNYAITNLTSPGGRGFVVEAKLNNSGNIGDNDSPYFITPAAKNFCVGIPGQQNFVFPQFSLENDGDSVRYEWGNPQELSGSCGNATFNDIPFVSPLTVNQPMSTYTGITLNQRNGTFSFLPNQSGVVVMKTVIKEYRFDSTLTAWAFIGSSTRDVQIPVLATCNQSSQAGPQVNMSTSTGNTTASISRDSLKALSNYLNIPISNSDSALNGPNWEFQIPVIDYTCYSDRITVEFDPETEVMCGSIADNGSDFRIVGPDGSLRPVTGVDKKCPTNKIWTDEVDLLLHKPLDINGRYYLYIKPGDDGNTLENFCGFQLTKYFLIILEVDDCPTLDYGIENVSVVNDAAVKVDWYADTTTYKLFNEWWILRSANTNPNFYPLAKLSDPNARSFIDTTMDMAQLDAFNFRYAIQMIQNFSAKDPTRTVTDILFTDSITNDSSAFGFSWSRYNGYEDNLYPSDTTEYEVFIGRVDTNSGFIVWNSFDGPFYDTFNSSWQFPTEEEKEANEDTLGVYAFKVVASPGQLPSNPYTSESNWIYVELYNFKEEEPKVEYDSLIFPNVFTPNGDMQNDVFIVKNAEPYTQPGDLFTVSVYNRWGKLVYEEGDYGPRNNETNGWNGDQMGDGSKLADGVYYYVVKMKDAATGKTEEHKGQLHLMTGTGMR